MKTIIIKIHSFVDLITNSSTEIFATIKGEKETIEKVIKEVLGEFGCEAVEMYVDEDYDDDEETIKGQYRIMYDYECHSYPCKIIEKKLSEKLSKLFTIIEEY